MWSSASEFLPVTKRTQRRAVDEERARQKRCSLHVVQVASRKASKTLHHVVVEGDSVHQSSAVATGGMAHTCAKCTSKNLARQYAPSQDVEVVANQRNSVMRASVVSAHIRKRRPPIAGRAHEHVREVHHCGSRRSAVGSPRALWHMCMHAHARACGQGLVRGCSLVAWLSSAVVVCRAGSAWFRRWCMVHRGVRATELL